MENTIPKLKGPMPCFLFLSNGPFQSCVFYFYFFSSGNVETIFNVSPWPVPGEDVSYVRKKNSILGN
jgi:hypothetical protein